MVLHVVGRKADYKMHLHVLAMDGGIDRETGEWVNLPDFRYELLHKKWQYHLLKMVKDFFKSSEMLKLVDQLWKRYPKGFVAQILKGNVPKKMEKLTKYLSKYLFRPAIANKRIKKYDPVAGTVVYTYQSHNTKRTEVETIDVFKFLGRMVQQIMPKGFQRVRYYGLQATASYARSKERIQEAMGLGDADSDLGPDRFVAEGKVTVSVKKTGYDKKVFELTGEHPLNCLHCGQRMEVVKVWSKKYGVLVDRLAALKRAAKPVTSKVDPIV